MDTYVTRKEFEVAMATVATKSEVVERIEQAIKDSELRMMRRFDNFTEEFSKKFNKIDEKLAQIDEKFARIDTQLKLILKRLPKK